MWQYAGLLTRYTVLSQGVEFEDVYIYRKILCQLSFSAIWSVSIRFKNSLLNAALFWTEKHSSFLDFIVNVFNIIATFHTYANVIGMRVYEAYMSTDISLIYAHLKFETFYYFSCILRIEMIVKIGNSSNSMYLYLLSAWKLTTMLSEWQRKGK